MPELLALFAFAPAVLLTALLAFIAYKLATKLATKKQ